MVMVVFATTIFVFALSRMAGDPRDLFLTEYTTQEFYDAWGREMGLDRPLVVQYLIWISKAARGDFGKSLRDQINALEVIGKRIPATLQLSAGAFIFSLAMGVPLGVLSAVKRGSFWDYLGRTAALLGQALPPFWLGIMLVLIFAVQFDLLPTGRRGGVSHYILPSITLGWASGAGILRLMRSAMLEVLDSEFVKFARAKGVKSSVVIWKHAFKSAIIVPLTFAGLVLAGFITGTVVTETVFSWPGLGKLAVDAVFNNDFPVLTGAVLLFTVMYVLVNLLVDIAYGLIDPRIRYS
jgi:peptide/nickel transport system permease protein